MSKNEPQGGEKRASAKSEFIQRCRDMDLNTARQAASVLCDELGVTPGTAMVYYSAYLASVGKGVKRPRKSKKDRGGSTAEGASNTSGEIGGE